MAESGTGSSIGFGNTRYPYYYGPNSFGQLNSKYQEQKKNEEVND